MRLARLLVEVATLVLGVMASAETLMRNVRADRLKGGYCAQRGTLFKFEVRREGVLDRAAVSWQGTVSVL